MNSICLKKKLFYFVNKYKEILLEPAATPPLSWWQTVTMFQMSVHLFIFTFYMTTRRDLTEDGELLGETSVRRAFLLQKHKTLNQTELKILR